MANLNETVSEIKETFADIRSAIIEKGVDVGECESPTVYADRILDIQGGGGNGIMLTNVTAEAYEVYGEPTANVRLSPSGTEMAFTFGLARGAKGDKGDPGATGPAGPAGPAGSSTMIEHIYKLETSIDVEVDTPDSVNIDGHVPDGWEPRAMGVDNDYRVEYFCERSKKNGIWSDWSDPAVWSMFGQVGKDGKGVEYIFCLTKDVSNTPSVPDSDPDKDESTIKWPLVKNGFVWHDDPQSVSETVTCCWVSTRKQQYNDDDTTYWGPYSKPAIWSRWGKDGKEGGGRTVFIYTAVEGENVKSVHTPIGGSWNPERNEVVVPTCPEGKYTWSTNPPQKTKVTEKYWLWLSTATFDSAGVMISDGWCEPYCLTGEDGVNGTDGTTVQFVYRLITNMSNYNTLYKYHVWGNENGIKLESKQSDNDAPPTKIDKLSTLPTDNDLDPENWNSITKGDESFYTIVDTEWTDEPMGIGESIDGKTYSIECVCTRRKVSEKITDSETGEETIVEKWSEWSMPLLWSVWGEDGMDGAGVEYIYCVTPEVEDVEGETTDSIDGNSILLQIPPASWWKNPTSEEYSNWYNDLIPKGRYWEIYNTYEFAPNAKWLEAAGCSETEIKAWDHDWTDEPQDVDENQPLEWVRIRRQKHTQNESGKQVLEWGDFSYPVLWNKYTHDGVAFKTSYIFIRSKKRPEVPTLPETSADFNQECFGDYNNSVPASFNSNGQTWKWYDGIPEGSDPVWMTNITFRSNDLTWNEYRNTHKTDDKTDDELFLEWKNSIMDSDWDNPMLMSDSLSVQVEYYHPNLDTSKQNPDGSWPDGYLSNPPGINGHEPLPLQSDYEREFTGDEKLEYTNSKSKDPIYEYFWKKANTCWTDDSNGNPTYMAMCYLKPGTSGTPEWTNWDIIRIKGEKGDAGKNGTSVSIIGTASIVDEIPDGIHAVDGKEFKWVFLKDEESYTLYKYLGNEWQPYESPNVGDGVMVGTHLWVWDQDSWEDVGQIKGDSPVVYIAFSNDNGNTLTDYDSISGKFAPGKYIGIWAAEFEQDKDAVQNPAYYTWSKWGGDDGWGQEQIFLLTTNYYNEDNRPEIPKDSEEVKDYQPDATYLGKDYIQGSNWSDRPLSPRKEYPYCWVVSRTVGTNNYSDWKGVDENGYNTGKYVSLYQKYYYPNVFIELSNDQAVVPLDTEGNIDEDFKTPITTSVTLYSGDDTVVATEEFPVTISFSGLTSYDEVIVEGESLDSNGTVTFTNNTSSWNISIPIKCIGSGDIVVNVTYDTQRMSKTFHILKTKAAYEFKLETAALFKNRETGMLEGVDTVKGILRKWVDNTWKPISNETVTLDYYIANNNTPAKMDDTTEEGHFKFNLSNIYDLTKVKVSANDGEIFEDIMVYADGPVGPAGEPGVTYTLETYPEIIELSEGTYNPSSVFVRAFAQYGTNPREEDENAHITFTIDNDSNEHNYDYEWGIEDLYSYSPNNSITFKWYDDSNVYASKSIQINNVIKPSWSINIPTPTIWVDSESGHALDTSCKVPIYAYLENSRQYISGVNEVICTINGDYYDCTWTNESSYVTFDIPQNTAIQSCTYEFDVEFDNGKFKQTVVCDVLRRAPKGNDAVSPIAVHLSNPSMELSWFANGDVSLNSAECIITAVKENNPVAITVGNNIESSPFKVTVEDNNTERVVIKVSSADKIDSGTYTINIPITIESETIERVIYVTVKEIPNVDTDVIMDQSINVVYAEKTTDDKWVWDWGNLMSDGGAVVEKIEGKTYYYEKFAGIKNIYAKQNGVIVNKDSLKILSINIGDIFLEESTGGTEGHYVFDEGNLIFSVINLMKILQEQTIIEGTITFDVNGVSVDKKVLFNTNRTAYKRDVQLFPKEANYGEDVTVSLNVRQWNTDGSWKEEPWDDYTDFNIYNGDTKLTPSNGELTFRNVIEDIELSFKWKYDDGSEELCDIQTISCVKQPVLDIWSIKASNPFVKVTHNAFEGSGELVGNPISLIVQHQVGETVETFNDLPEGYNIKWTCGDQNGTIENQSLINLRITNWFTSKDPIVFELCVDNVVIDSVTVEKTIVYPEPLVYPAGSYDSTKTYNLDYYRVPYISVKTASDIKYYVANRDILTDVVTYTIEADTLEILGDNVTSRTHNGYPIWKQMESFEAIYADIGVFKQALVGPLVFYGDYVFSQNGIETNTGNEKKYSDVPWEELETTNFWESFKPNFKLNAKTGKFELSAEGSTINIGDSITIGGANSEITVDDIGEYYQDGTPVSYGTLKIGADTEQVIAYQGVDYDVSGGARSGYFGVGHGNAPSCSMINGGGFVNITQNTSDIGWDQSYCYGFGSTPSLTLSNKPDDIALNILSGQAAGLRPYIGTTNDLDRLGSCPMCFSPSVYLITNGTTITLPINKFVQDGDSFEVWKYTSDNVTIECEKNMHMLISDDFAEKTSHTWKTPGRYKFLYYNNSWYVTYMHT